MAWRARWQTAIYTQRMTRAFDYGRTLGARVFPNHPISMWTANMLDMVDSLFTQNVAPLVGV